MLQNQKNKKEEQGRNLIFFFVRDVGPLSGIDKHHCGDILNRISYLQSENLVSAHVPQPLRIR